MKYEKGNSSTYFIWFFGILIFILILNAFHLMRTNPLKTNQHSAARESRGLEIPLDKTDY